MGNKLTLDSSYGSVRIDPTQTSYFSGDQVNGFVHLDLVREFPHNILYLALVGKEENEVATGEEKSLTQKLLGMKNTVKSSHDIYKHEFPLYAHNAPTMPAGQYSFPFSFKLTEALPSTYKHQWESHGESCFANISYNIWAGMKDEKKGKGLFSSIDIGIERIVPEYDTPQHVTFNERAKAYCYKDLGMLKLECKMPTGKLRIGDEIIVAIDVDNSQGKGNIKTIDVSLVQSSVFMATLKIKQNCFIEIISTASYKGVNAGQTRMGENALQVRVPVNDNPEIKPSLQGVLCVNVHQLVVTCTYDENMCCGNVPTNIICVQICSKNLPQHKAPWTHSNWNPKMMPLYVCTITPDYVLAGSEKTTAEKTVDMEQKQNL